MSSRLTVLPSYRFEVHIERNTLGFRSISGLKLTSAFEPLAVGGFNESPVLLPVPVKEPGRLTMERGVSSLHSLSDFIPGELIANEMQIHILNENNKPIMSYSVASPFTETIELSKLDAMESSVLIKTFSVLHHGITCL